MSRSSRRHIILDDLDQAVALVVGLGKGQGFDRAAQRGQRILELVADIGGEGLDRVDAVVERRRHVAQRARQMADLVAPLVKSGISTRLLMPRRTRSAAAESRRIGSAMVPARSTDSRMVTRRHEGR